MALEGVLGGPGVGGVLEVDEREAPPGVVRVAVERAEFAEDAHEVGVGGFGEEVADPQGV